MVDIKLGQKVRDEITGYTGIAVARTEWLYGCVRVTVQSSELHNGMPVEAYIVDEPQLEVVTEKEVLNPIMGHGDRPNVKRQRSPERR